MKRFAFLSIITVAAAACQSGVETESNWMSFEEFVDSYVFVEPATGMYIVNGDETIRTEAELREFYSMFSGDALIVHQSGGVDVKWDDTTKLNLTYCVSDDFGSRKAEMVAALDVATGDWEAAADVDFIHVSSLDSRCSARTDVVFDVRPVSQNCQYLARAFFPNYSRRDRNVLVDTCSFTYADSGQVSLAGVLRHELGHTLGFRHEHTRPESGACFEDDNWRELTSYDSSSCMHYPQCNGTNDWDLAMTSKDRAGAASLYGAPGSTGGGGGGGGGGGECLASGDVCSSNADCCSNKCRGRRGDKVCR